MFKDESVTITQSIKNVKDIDKIFTSFSKTFSLPASQTNNKIFKHYYNFDIVGGFDARIRKASNIELNNLPFTEGLIKLEGVDLKDNKPHTYKITFFGNTVTLKDTLGDDKLSGLTSLTSLNKTYDASSVRASLQLNPNLITSDIIVPLITHTERLTFDTAANNQTVGNIGYHNGHNQGVLYTDLKYAIRLHSIIEAIETKYPSISFSNDFFNNTNQSYYGLFMWLHRKKGDVQNRSNLNERLLTGFPNGSDSGTNSTMLNNALSLSYVPEPNELNNPNGYTSLFIKTTTSNRNLYRVSVRRDGVEVANSGDITTGQQFTTSVNFNEIQKDSSYTIYIESNFSLFFSAIDFQVFKYAPNQSAFTKTYSTGTYQYNTSLQFDITQQIPDIKVIDFLSGLFRMFNLIAYIERNETEITVKTLDDFYANPTSASPYDITKYIDVSKSQVNIALPYRKINLRHEDTKTFLAAKHTQLFGETWGEAQFDFGEKLDGGIYNVKTPFSQMKYERLIDANTSLATTAQWGWSVDDNQEPHLGKPLLFYPIKISGGNIITFLNTPTNIAAISNYIVPSNSVSLSSATSSYNMNFNAEQNEWGALESPADTGFTNSLFEAYYKNYITSVFNPSNRITKVSAYLPLKILLNYTLADRFIIGGNSYKINSITTNLETGKSELELLNDL